MTELERQLRKNVVDTEAAYDYAVYDYAVNGWSFDWDDVNYAYAKARDELNKYLEVQDNE